MKRMLTRKISTDLELNVNSHLYFEKRHENLEREKELIKK